ncbi:hypothetical protein [uncultured Methylobacterium sp.]|uniref:hypothetical protein n=1 Tax=uncultured Methylobacterium sp. TaxID=157278 RepID=UPI0035CB1D04
MPSRSSIRRGLSWNRVLSEMLHDRATQPAVREERLRVLAGLRAAPVVALSAWRGRSGRRYVVQVHDIATAASIEAPGSVILGVRRDEAGIALLLGAGHAGTVAEGARLAALDGATEIHLHRLADTVAERDAMVGDLVDHEGA